MNYEYEDFVELLRRMVMAALELKEEQIFFVKGEEKSSL